SSPGSTRNSAKIDHGRAEGTVKKQALVLMIVSTSVSQHAQQAGVRQRIEFLRLEGSFSPDEPLFMPVPGNQFSLSRSALPLPITGWGLLPPCFPSLRPGTL